jgi:hypothetical protein
MRWAKREVFAVPVLTSKLDFAEIPCFAEANPVAKNGSADHSKTRMTFSARRACSIKRMST